MEEKKGQGTLYLVIGIATLVVAIIGATFAYFSAQASTGAEDIKGGTLDIKQSFSVEAVRVYKDETVGVKLSGKLQLNNNKGTDGADIFNSIFAGKNDFTVEAWVNPTRTDMHYNMIMGKGDSNFGLRTRDNLNGSIILDFFIKATDGNWYTVEKTINVPDNWIGNWQQIVATYTGNELKIYLNGELMGTSNERSTGGLATNNQSLWLGYCPETSRNSSYEIGAARVYNRALTDTEVKAQKNGFI